MCAMEAAPLKSARQEASAMALGKVLARGQVTLPRDVRRAADLKPGDRVTFRVTKEGTVEIRPLPRLRLKDLLERYKIEEPIDMAAAREEWQAQAAQEVLRELDEQRD
jgi:AbrB family looped-hinge helix DNA binding protein